MAQHHNPERARQAATSIARTLRDHGHTAYFAGGCVRDELLGLRPTDYDVATDAPPKRVQSIFRKTASVGVSFGVILVSDFGPSVEVATFRAEGPYTDKRRPDHVTFATPNEDARRRDFTINALFLDPLAAEDSPAIHGHVVDLVGGLDDLKAGVIRAVGDPDKRLDEDHLRALRAVRFASRFNFEIEPRTRDAITRHARQLAGVSRERIGDELRRMLSPGRDSSANPTPTPPTSQIAPPPPIVAVQLLEALELDTPTLTPPSPLPITAPDAVLDAPVRSTTHPVLTGLLDQTWQSTLLSPHSKTPSLPHPLDPTISAMDVLAAWAIDRYPVLKPKFGTDPATTAETQDAGLVAESVAAVISELAARWRAALCLSNNERDRFVGVLTLLHKLNPQTGSTVDPDYRSWLHRPIALRKRTAADPAFLPALRLLHAASAVRHGLGSADPTQTARQQQLDTTPQDILSNVRELAADGIGIEPPPLLTGDHLIEHGHQAGPHFKGVLAAVYDEQLEGRVRTVEQGLASAEQRLARRP